MIYAVLLLIFAFGIAFCLQKVENVSHEFIQDSGKL